MTMSMHRLSRHIFPALEQELNRLEAEQPESLMELLQINRPGLRLRVIPDAEVARMTLDERCHKVTALSERRSLKVMPVARFALSSQAMQDFRRDAQAALQGVTPPVTEAPLPKTFDGIPSEIFNGKAPRSKSQVPHWAQTGALIRMLRGSQSVFVAEPHAAPVPSADKAAAPRLMLVEKIPFLLRLTSERNALAAQVARSPHNKLNTDLLSVMDAMIPLVLTTPFYEDAAAPDNFPAYFIEHGPTAGVHFAPGAFYYTNAFHEMAHRLQMESKERRLMSHSAGTVHYFDPHNTTSAEQYLWREEEVYQWQVAYTFFKAGYTPYEVFALEDSLRQIVRLQDANHLQTKDCNVLAGQAPAAYAEVAKLLQRIEQIPDFSKEEARSAQAHVTAYFNIDVDKNGIMRIEKGQLPWLLSEFYKDYLAGL